MVTFKVKRGILNKIIVFKSDRVGDLIYFSPCLSAIKDNNRNSHITLVCSIYNYQIAKNYIFIDKFIILDEKNFLITLLRNFRNFFLTNYKYLFQYDGKAKSYFLSFFIKASIKSTLCYVKHKKILNFNYIIYRPRKFLLKLFFKNFLFCDEKYTTSDKSRQNVHYQTLYFKILENLNFNINNKKNLFFLDYNFEDIYKSFFNKHIYQEYYLFHFDEKWDRCNSTDYKNTMNIINKISSRKKLIITTGIKKFSFLKTLENKFTTYDYYHSKFNLLNKKENDSVIILKNLPLNLLAFFIKNSEKNISFHSGPIVHISPCFDKPILDLIPISKNDELDRWIPTISDYTRINFENINDDIIKSI